MMMEECISSLFRSLYVSLIFMSWKLYVFLWCWYYAMLLIKRELWNVSMRGNYVYVSLSILNGYESCFEKNEENKWRLCLEVFLMVELRRGLWGLLGGNYGVLGTFLLDSQPLDEFLFCFWSMRSSSIIFMSCLFWEI